MFTEQPVAPRFWAKVNKGEGCWEWTSKRRKGPHPYGKFYLKRRWVSAHRMAWVLTHGELAEEMDVLHRCDNPPCVRPDHLFLGTQTENNKDRDQKKRTSKGEKHSSVVRKIWQEYPESFQPFQGEGHHLAKLNREAVREIRRLAASGTRRCELAKMFGVVPGNIRMIVSRKTWKSVP